MGINSKEIIVPKADQSQTTGAVLAGGVQQAIPQTFAEAQAALSNLESTGYVGEDGIKIASSYSLSDFREMNRGIVRRAVDEVSATITHTELQIMNERVLKMKFGEGNVSVVAATTGHGKQMRVKMGTELPPVRTYAYKLKDGDTRAIVWVPRGQITNGIEITAASNAMMSVPVEVSCYDDGTGGLYYIFFDDGTTVAVTASSELDALTIGSATLSPSFASDALEYTATASASTGAVTATPKASGAGVVVAVNGNSIANGDTATWQSGENDVAVTVTNGTSSTTYHVAVSYSSE